MVLIGLVIVLSFVGFAEEASAGTCYAITLLDRGLMEEIAELSCGSTAHGRVNFEWFEDSLPGIVIDNMDRCVNCYDFTGCHLEVIDEGTANERCGPVFDSCTTNFGSYHYNANPLRTQFGSNIFPGLMPIEVSLDSRKWLNQCIDQSGECKLYNVRGYEPCNVETQSECEEMTDYGEHKRWGAIDQSSVPWIIRSDYTLNRLINKCEWDSSNQKCTPVQGEVGSGLSGIIAGDSQLSVGLGKKAMQIAAGETNRNEIICTVPFQETPWFCASDLDNFDGGLKGELIVDKDGENVVIASGKLTKLTNSPGLGDECYYPPYGPGCRQLQPKYELRGSIDESMWEDFNEAYLPITCEISVGAYEHESTQSILPKCGDGIVQVPKEQCDEGGTCRGYFDHQEYLDANGDAVDCVSNTECSALVLGTEFSYVCEPKKTLICNEICKFTDLLPAEIYVGRVELLDQDTRDWKKRIDLGDKAVEIDGEKFIYLNEYETGERDLIGCSINSLSSDPLISNANVKLIYEDSSGADQEVEKVGVDLQCAGNDCNYILEGGESNVIVDELQLKDSEERKLRCEVVIGTNTYVSDETRLFERNIKDESKYQGNLVFLMGDNDWRTVLQAVPVATWDGDLGNDDDGDDSWCEEIILHGKDEGIETEVQTEKCGYPLFAYHREGDNVGPGVSNNILWDPPADNEREDTIKEFVKRYDSLYSTFKIVSVKEDSSDNVAEEVGNNVVPSPYYLGVIETPESDYYKSYWEEYGLVILVDHGGDLKDEREIEAYKNGLLGAQLAAYYNAPLVFVDDENFDSVKRFLKDKMLIVLGDLSLGASNSLELEKNSIILSFKGNHLELDSFNQGITFDSPIELQDYLEGLSFESELGKYNAVFVNPNDIKKKYCESLPYGGKNFDEMYCKNSLLGPYIGFAFDNKLEFVETEPAPGILDLVKLENDWFDEYEEETEDDLKQWNIDGFKIAKDIFELISLEEFQNVLLSGEQKAIPYGKKQSIFLDGKQVYNSLDRYYSDRNQDGLIPDDVNKDLIADLIISRVNGRTVTQGFIEINRELFNIQCGQEEDYSCGAVPYGE